MTPVGLHPLQRDQRAVPVDGHVHFHSPERVVPTLDAAMQNFRAASGIGSGCLGALLLNEAPGERVFNELLEHPVQGAWRIAPCTAEQESLVCHRGDGWIVVVCGRQIPCERGLEVAALGTTDEFPERRPLEETVRRVQESGALAILPWGFGKWMGSRGRLVRQAIDRHDPSELAIGDNGGRLSWTGMPPLVRAAARRGYRIVPGTDPFPFGDDFRRVGAFGFFFEGEPGMDAPWAELSNRLEQQQQPELYGRALGPVRFAWNQAGMQAYNYFKKRRAAA